MGTSIGQTARLGVVAERFGCVRRKTVLAAWVLFASGMASALAAPPVVLIDASFMEIDEMVASAKGRPNEEMRLRGLKSYQSGQYGDAVAAFEVAAYYADKYSQHYLSLLHWNGVGVPVDHVQAYIWADLAAERGSRQLLTVREKMWSQLTAAEQAQVVPRGEVLYARYGDSVAKPRAESKMRTFARQMTGSHAGYSDERLQVQSAPASGTWTGPGSKTPREQVASATSLYGKDGGFVGLRAYWREQDRVLNGKVDVGPLETITEPHADAGGNNDLGG